MPAHRFGPAAWATALAVGLLSAACDGYPTEDEPMPSFADMSAGELMDELNRIGERRHLKPRRSYALREGCELEVALHGKASERTRMSLALDGAAVRSRVDPESRTHGVLLVSARSGDEDDATLSVIEGGKWVDAVQVRSLLQNLQRSCSSAAADTDGAGDAERLPQRRSVPQRSRPT